MSTSELIQKLFTWKTEFEYRDTKWYQRIVPDSVVEDARKHALVESRRLRQKLRDETSDEYLIYIDPVQDLTDEEIKAALTFVTGREAMQDYVRTTPKPVISAPADGATLEEQERYEADMDERDRQYIEDVREYVSRIENEYRVKLQTATREILVREYRKIQTDQVCETKFQEEFELFLLSASIFTDAKYRNRAFSYNEFKELPTDVRQHFRDMYNSINVDQESVKN